MQMTVQHKLQPIFTDIEAGVLAVFLNERLLDGLENLLETINSIASG